MNEPCATPTRNRFAIRVALGSLGLVQLIDGLYALFAPTSFYSDFPLGRGWVAALPAYNEHLVRDVGSLFLATAFLLLVAAAVLERRLVIVSAITFLLFSVPHTIYHLLNLGPYTTGDAVANVLGLAATVLLPAWVLVEMRRQGRGPLMRGASESPGGGNARIAAVPDGGGGTVAKLAFRESRRRYGEVADPLRVYAHHPKVLLGYAALETATERSTSVPGRLKHLAETRAAMICGCEWCLDFATAISPEFGVEEADLVELPNYRSSERFSDLEKSVLDYATGISRSPVDVPGELFESLREQLDEAQLVELTNVIALENYRARFNWAFGIEGQGFSEGSFCVAPEAAAVAEPGSCAQVVS